MSDAAWVRAPRQARSQATLERFVEATQQLLAERRFEEITVADIVTTAGRTVGSFYARFEDKHAVLHVLVERLDGRIRDVVHAFCDPVRWEGSPATLFIEESVRLNVGAYRRSAPLFRAALMAAANDERFRDRRMATLHFSAEQQKAFLRTRADELGCPDVARASDRAFELMVATLDHELLFGRFTTTSPHDDRQLVDELARQACWILGAPREDEPEPMVVETEQLIGSS
jgi:AcrR family transcriptional regulator